MTTDLSESAESAFEYAKEQFKLAGKKKSKITLLKVIDVMPLAGIQFEYGLAIADKNRMKLHKLASDKIRGIAKNTMERSLFRREAIYCIFGITVMIYKPNYGECINEHTAD